MSKRRRRNVRAIIRKLRETSKLLTQVHPEAATPSNVMDMQYTVRELCSLLERLHKDHAEALEALDEAKGKLANYEWFTEAIDDGSNH